MCVSVSECVCVCESGTFACQALTNTNVIRPPDMEPLLQQKVPETFVKLQDIVRRLAQDCSRENRAPILTRQEYL